MKEQFGGYLYYYIYELDCVQYLFGEILEMVIMIGGNLVYFGLGFGNEDDMLFMILEFLLGKLVILEWGSVFNWLEYYVIINGIKGFIKIDM